MSKPFCHTSRDVTPTTRQVGVLGEPEAAQQVGLARGLAGEVRGRVRLRDVRVVARVPLVVVDAVQDPEHVARAGAHDAVEAVAQCSGPWISRA